MIRRASERVGAVSIIDAVMGEDWARLKLRRPLRPPQLAPLVSQQIARTSTNRRLSFAIAARGSQAMVKLVGRGGVKNAGSLRDQMRYLGRGGDVPLLRSDRYAGREIDDEVFDRMVDAWGLDLDRTTGSDRTTHFVVSFPADTDRDAAERAGRAWADEMFGGGRFSDAWDYYTAYHRDTDYPHIHVVVNRRGLESGTWLTISRRSEITFDILREVQVEVARREHIHLEATPRLARGLHDRPVPDAEVRRARAEGRAPEAPAHTPVTACVAAATVIAHAKRFAAEANAIRERYPEFAARLDVAARTLEEGRSLDDASSKSLVYLVKEENEMATAVEEKEQALLSEIKQMDSELRDVPNGQDRVQLQREVATMKAEAAQWVQGSKELEPYRQPARNGDYAGLAASADKEDSGRAAIIQDADRRSAELATASGVDPSAQIERYRTPQVSEGLAADFRRDEAEERRRTLGPEDGAKADAELTRLRRETAQVYDDANRRLASMREADAETTAAPQDDQRQSQQETIDRARRDQAVTEQLNDQAAQRRRQERDSADRDRQDRDGLSRNDDGDYGL